jgi:hypothetical protein
MLTYFTAMPKAKVRILLLLFLLSATQFYGQSRRAIHWYFGWQAGINFNAGIPQTDTTSKLISIEGSASISDTTGNLLFYSNGEVVWNKNNLVMPNGNGLIGDQSSVQSALIVPLPGNNSTYYLFTSAGNSPQSGLRYNIIDMNLNGGLGDLISKNQLLFSGGTEELAGTIHCNTKDYWIIARKLIKDTLRFYAYLLTANGMKAPVINEFNVSTPIWNTVGTLTFSQEGKLLAFSSFASDIYLLDFNIETGRLTLKNNIQHYNNEYVYSNAISPDNKKLYITSWVPNGYNYLSQFDLTASNIFASRVNIDSTDYRFGSPNGYGLIGQLKIGPDQKIYVSRWNQDHPYQVNPNTFYSLDSLDAIIYPNNQGLSCGFQRNFLHLNHKPTMLGLPNFISNFTSPTVLSENCKHIDDTVAVYYLKIYPNPFHQHLYVKTNFPDKSKLKVRIIDMLGRVVNTATNITADGFEIKLQFFANALYFVQVFRNEDVIATKKIIAY